MADSELEIVVDDPTAPEENSPAVTNNRTVEIVVVAVAARARGDARTTSNWLHRHRL